MGLRQDHPVSAICPVSGKGRYTKGEAKSIAKRKARSKRSVNLSAYKCRGCGSWHVGNQRRFS